MKRREGLFRAKPVLIALEKHWSTVSSTILVSLVMCSLGEINSFERKTMYIRERLDKAVGNESWREWFPLVHIKNDDHFHSDHRPVVIFLEGLQPPG